jgi:hypothetical protein
MYAILINLKFHVHVQKSFPCIRTLSHMNLIHIHDPFCLIFLTNFYFLEDGRRILRIQNKSSKDNWQSRSEVTI